MSSAGEAKSSSVSWRACAPTRPPKSAGHYDAALFYTLFETAKLSQVDPGAYVTQAATRAIQNPGAVTLPSELT